MCLVRASHGIHGARLQLLPSVCQRGNPPSRPICASPVFSSCLRILWDEGWGPCLFPHPLHPLLDAIISGPNLGLLHWLLKARAAPRAPHLCREAGSSPACMGGLAKSWRARAGGLGVISAAWHWACTQDLSATTAEWPSHS